MTSPADRPPATAFADRGTPLDHGAPGDREAARDDQPAGDPRPPDGLFTAIDHVGVAVSDYEAAVDFYRRVFGMRLVHEEVNEEQGVREAMLAVGDSGSCVQVLAPLTPESAIARFLERSGPGVQQVAYRVDDVDAVSATLRERGLRLLYESPRRGTAGSRINFVHPKDAGGVLVELVEPART